MLTLHEISNQLESIETQHTLIDALLTNHAKQHADMATQLKRLSPTNIKQDPARFIGVFQNQTTMIQSVAKDLEYHKNKILNFLQSDTQSQTTLFTVHPDKQFQLWHINRHTYQIDLFLTNVTCVALTKDDRSPLGFKILTAYPTTANDIESSPYAKTIQVNQDLGPVIRNIPEIMQTNVSPVYKAYMTNMANATQYRPKNIKLHTPNPRVANAVCDEVKVKDHVYSLLLTRTGLSINQSHTNPDYVVDDITAMKVMVAQYPAIQQDIAFMQKVAQDANANPNFELIELAKQAQKDLNSPTISSTPELQYSSTPSKTYTPNYTP